MADGFLDGAIIEIGGGHALMRFADVLDPVYV